ncbi:hypothetical protein O1611_g6734 [Lasiodiplodia mahajangana]|uniref:Uncharacterized protein n=1 Tax=Lasiodiplodia mahajangana TaxID=1108764 RepID=A0ACC2JHG0_9PEZI|nr:hypothetical protein O1611_g6734 [Lasiodiplodia mahajangana]
MVQHKKNPHNSANGNTSKESPRMSFQKRDMPDTRSTGGSSGKGTNKPNGTSGFRTDTAISSSRNRGERVLQPWVAPTGSEGIDMTLEKSTSGRAWDQFAANERQFGIRTTYDENIYTTAIDKSHPQYKERLAKAEKAAKEIEGSATTTAHHAEERQMNFAGGDDAGEDEEEKYSGVKRQDFPPLGNRDTKYTPPARRAPAGASTVKGAPVDPAIISSQLRTQRPQLAPKLEDNKAQATPVVDTTAAPLPTQTSDSRPDSKADSLQKPVEPKPANQVPTPTPLKPSAATGRTISPRSKDAQSSVPNATATVERDVLKDFKSFAQQQRMTVDKARHTKAKADKEVKLIELKRFASSFKLPTPVPLDLIGIIAKDPAKQREIQEKANRDALEVAKRKAEEAKEKEKKEPAGTSTESQQNVAPAAPVESRSSRTANALPTTGPSAPIRNQGGRATTKYQFPNNRSGQQHAAPANRPSLSNRILEQKSQAHQAQEMRVPTGPANSSHLHHPYRMVPNHLGAKLNPNSHEFRPSGFAPTFSPNGHPSAGSSPRSAINHANGPASAPAHVIPPIVISKKGRKPDPTRCNILAFAKTIQPPETKNWGENGNLRPSYDTPPTWRSIADDEKADSTMHLSCDEFFERQPFTTQPTPNPPHVLPQHMPHQHQLPLHLQHVAHNVPRHSPHAAPVQMHGGQHNPIPHGPFNGADDHRMMHSNSNQSFSSPRMSHHVPLAAYPGTIHSTPQMPYGQQIMPPFMGPGAPQMNNFNRSLSNNPQFMPQQAGAMGGPMMIQPHFMTPAMVPGPPQMHMYGGGQSFIPPGATPQPIPGAANGYPSPGRPSAPMMVPGGSSQGQVMYAASPSMQYQQPYAPQQGQINNMRPYNGAGSQYGSSPQQMHQYPGPPHRNGSSNNYNKNYQSHNQHHGPNTHAVPTGPQGRTTEGPDEAK